MKTGPDFVDASKLAFDRIVDFLFASKTTIAPSYDSFRRRAFVKVFLDRQRFIQVEGFDLAMGEFLKYCPYLQSQGFRLKDCLQVRR